MQCEVCGCKIEEEAGINTQGVVSAVCKACKEETVSLQTTLGGRKAALSDLLKVGDLVKDTLHDKIYEFVFSTNDIYTLSPVEDGVPVDIHIKDFNRYFQSYKRVRAMKVPDILSEARDHYKQYLNSLHLALDEAIKTKSNVGEKLDKIVEDEEARYKYVVEDMSELTREIQGR